MLVLRCCVDINQFKNSEIQKFKNSENSFPNKFEFKFNVNRFLSIIDSNSIA